MDKITLEQMAFYGYHGVYSEERKLGQRFYVDVSLYLDLSAAGVSDRLEDTVNYAQVYATIRKIMEEEKYLLIEKAAERIAVVLLEEYVKLDEVSVRVVKPHPPFQIYFNGVSVEIHRKRTG